LHFHGWSPTDPRNGSSPLEALKQILAEQLHAQTYRQQVWERGGRVGSVLSRPVGAPPWSDDARKRFATDWRSKWSGDDGPKAGGTPILEDGMTLQGVRFSANDEQFVEAAKLALTVVAGVYHVNPTMIGLLDNANYSNVREFRRMLYGDTLGPTMAQIEARINAFLPERMDLSAPNVYVEFNINEKLQGSFEEQSAALQSAIGRPWMTADEGRALLNMPALGGDAEELVTPLNVLVGGQASPRDSGSQNVGGQASRSVRVKARAPETHEKRVQQVLAAFFKRQGAAVRSRLGAKADPDWWDGERWDKELAADLFKLSAMVSEQVAKSTLDGLGVAPDEYDVDRTLAFLKAVSDRIAGSINTATRAQIEQALASADDDDEDADPIEAVGHVFDVAESSRAEQAAMTAVTTFSAFGTTEAAKQASGGKATKTWVTTSGNPRSSHAAMNGETVGIDDKFSNGAEWPGDALNLDVDDVAGCQCDILISIG
jgi:hypothetical protein